MDQLIIPDGSEEITKHFMWRDALFLPKWFRMACAADGVTQQTLDNLKFLFEKMELVREYINQPIIVHVAYRSESYNKLVKGAPGSSHMALEENVAAVDFHISGMSCDAAKEKFMPMLEQWEMRMENNGVGAGWIHLDTRPVAAGGNRFFIP